MTVIAPAPGHLRAILINNNAAKTNSSNVDLTLSAKFAAEMIISNDEDFTGAVFEPYVTAKEWILLDEQIGPGFGDGTKIVYVKFRHANLTESDVFSASIVLDTVPPAVGAVPILINDGTITTESRQVTLNVNATNASTVEIFNEDELDTFTEGMLVPYSSTIPWTLSEGSGLKTVLISFIDDIGNKSAFFSDQVTLVNQDSKQPIVTDPVDGTITTDHFINIRGTGDPGSTVQINIDGYGS